MAAGQHFNTKQRGRGGWYGSESRGIAGQLVLLPFESPISGGIEGAERGAALQGEGVHLRVHEGDDNKDGATMGRDGDAMAAVEHSR